MILQKYKEIFRETNIELEKFNLLLAAEFRIAPLSASNSESCYVIANIPWDDQVWPPNKDFPGVYILCAHQQSDPNRLGAYIGKTSHNNISNRLDHWLRPYRQTGIYLKKDCDDEAFVIEAIIAIGLRDPKMSVLASALEEFIIAGVRKRVHLLNSTGN